jgi:hypothetical protein
MHRQNLIDDRFEWSDLRWKPRIVMRVVAGLIIPGRVRHPRGAMKLSMRLEYTRGLGRMRGRLPTRVEPPSESALHSISGEVILHWEHMR